ncbi:MAG: TetR/AcrR family transcriptional regulator [Candidatus Marinimicrobia bacterium]|nr:TetR/AcrR family transcriptional regulator [Candidatus Neomarinimicrobiota bacterium]
MRDTTKHRLFNYLDISLVRNGLTSITIEKISRDLKMSKKTIYSEYSNREELIRDYLFSYLNPRYEELEIIIESKKEAEDKLLSFLMIILTDILPKIIPSLHEIEMLFPAIWIDIETFRAKVIKNMIQIFRELENDGLLNPLVPVEQFAYIFSAIIQSTVQPKFIDQSHFASNELIFSFIRIILEGGCHPKLHNKLEKIITSIQDKEV